MLKHVFMAEQGQVWTFLLLGVRSRDRLEKVNNVMVHDLRQKGHGSNSDVLLARLNQREVLLRQPCQSSHFRLLQARLEAGRLEIPTKRT